jgi:hypothetical protein
MDATLKSDLETWLAPFVNALRHKTRARMCPAYVAGLIGAGDRKSVQPMAARDGEVGYDQLHHFIAGGAWDTAPLEKALFDEADRMVGAWPTIACNACRATKSGSSASADRRESKNTADPPDRAGSKGAARTSLIFVRRSTRMHISLAAPMVADQPAGNVRDMHPLKTCDLQLVAARLTCAVAAGQG